MNSLENYNNILRFTQKIISLAPYDKAAKALLIKEIESIRPLTEKKWLLNILKRK